MKWSNGNNKRFFDVASPHRRARIPIAYHLPLLAKLHLRGKHRRAKRAVLYTGTSIALVLFVLSFQIPALFANVRTFLPATCSGDWSNAAALTEDNAQTAAIATQSGQKVFCSFASLNLKESVPLERAMLSLTFETNEESESKSLLDPISETPDRTEDGSISEEPVPKESIEEPSSSQGGSSGAEEEPLQSEEQIVSKEPVSEPSVESPPFEEPAPVEEPVPEPSEEPAPMEESASEPSAFLFASVAHAQEVSEVAAESPSELEEEIVPAPESSVEEPVSELEVPPLDEEAPAPEQEPSPDTEPEESASTRESTSSGITLSYTIDGVVWTDVSSFSPRANEVTFDLSVPTTADFERLVIRITSDTVDEEITLSHLEMKLWTEAPLDSLLAPVDVPPGSHVFAREFTIDPEATHYCVFDPHTVDLSASTSTSFTVSLKKGDDIGEGADDLVAHASDAVLDIITPEESTEPSLAAPETVVESPAPSLGEEAASEQVPVLSEEEALSTDESIEEPVSLVDRVLEPLVETLEEIARIRVGTLEMGSLPMGIDIRFANESPYLVELFDDSSDSYLLAANVFAPDNAQQGSFSVPLVFTRTDGGESTVVCQINVINRPGSISVPEEAVETPEPELMP